MGLKKMENNLRKIDPSNDSQRNPYQHAWEIYRVQERLSRLATWGYLPGIAICWFVIKKIFNSEFLMGAVAVSWFFALIILDRKAAGFKCPRCGKYYFNRGLYHNGFTKECLNCGLKKWANSDRD